MSFRIKDGFTIGITDVFDNSARLLTPSIKGTATFNYDTTDTKDAVKIAGRNGGSSSYSGTITPLAARVLC